MFRKGLIASIPIVIGYVPVAMTFGIIALALGFSKVETLLTSALVFAGASQFALISLMPYSFVNAVFIPIFLNLRHIVYGYIVSQNFEIKKPCITAFGLTDEVFARSLTAPRDERFLWGLELGSYSAWVLGTAIGIVGGAFLISNKTLTPSLVFSLTALFLVLLIPNLKKYRLSAIMGGLIALIFHYFGYSSIGILLAGVVSPLIAMRLRR
ncbi:putative branched-chain amino acid permease (azaleucine resistance) [Archaeoglobus sulfaticallidus PM70-1]|uniref:Putative branched-chain amino acid permease (Azaleucine resistance) n=1 Tax=Archaeoglobus sulfaticallidus PM70-1 TaxID=387631 RepID=N0BEM8_9EURY|nr:AzlC family ABC transporter permease [Archaeoglobus sulfaticallidus]AGK62079.1 putative branched-chain amino acid permease (azaleucine resistance) [Archaeoglobus sulfaticallidus PM70-1]